MRSLISVMLAFVLTPVLSLLLPTSSSAANEARCGPVSIQEFGGALRSAGSPLRRPEIQLGAPGTYCLDQPVQQSKLMERRGRELTTIGGDGIILIGADDVSLDLGGNLVSNERSHGYTLIKHYYYEPGRRHSNWFSRTHIRNGRLLSPGSKGIGVRLIAANRYGPAGFGTLADSPMGKHLATVFLDTRHVVEGLQIEAGSRAILIDGRNNTIRNNHIIVDSATAIIAQGPGIVIEDNVIEVRNDFRDFSTYSRKQEALTPFPIRLIQADGAVIRNNRIRLVDRSTGTSLPAAIELIESRDVTVQGNHFGAIDEPVRADAVSSYSASGNESDPCPGSEPRYLAPGEAATEDAPRAPACR